MIRHYLTVAFRSMIQEKGYLLVNVIGLSVAVACCFLLIFWVKFELSYENSYLGNDRIYRLIRINHETGEKKTAGVSAHIGDDLKATFPQIETVTNFSIEKLAFVNEEEEQEKDGIMLAMGKTDEDFLRTFSYDYLEGSPESIVESRKAIITKEAAEKMFGKVSPMDKAIVFGETLRLNIGAVIDLPVNTDIRFDVLTFSNRGKTAYLMLKEKTELTSQLKQEIDKVLKESLNTEDSFELQAIRDMHLYSDWEQKGNLTQIKLFSVVAFLILLIAVINYINTSIARAINRLKEVGVRKISGSSRMQLVYRFLSDSFILSVFAVIIALLLAKILFPVFSEIMGLKTELYYDWVSILIAVCFCILISILSGGYAAFYLSSFNPAALFKGGSQTGSRDMFRKMLIGVQFFLCIGVLLCTVFIYRQINGVFNADTGVERKNIIVIDTSLWYDSENFIQEIKKNPNVIDATMGGAPPFNVPWTYSGVSWAGSNEEVKTMKFTQIFCDSHYADVFGLQVVEGIFIPPGLSWWQYATEESFHVVINESFQKLMGEENPLGITIAYSFGMKGKIIGVVKDFNFKPLKEPITPLIISFNPEATVKMFVRLTGNNYSETLKFVIDKYKEMKPDYASRPIMYTTAEEEYNNMYTMELRIAKLFLVFSIISLVLSIMGVISMISFITEKRTKEIAIRKINGASIDDIIRLFIKEVLNVGAIAAIPAILVAYFVMHQWLDTFVFRISLSWWIFLLVPLFVFVLVAAIMSIQLYSIAKKNPLDSLRME